MHEHMPSYERRKKRFERMNPAAYEKLREKVKGPEALAQDMDRNEGLAELAMALELEPKIQEELKKEIESTLLDRGFEAVVSSVESLSEESKSSLESGNYSLSVEPNPDTQQDQLVLTPEGNVSEKIPMNFSLSEQYIGQFQSSSSGSGTA